MRYLVLCLVLFFCCKVHAATFTVNSTADPGDGACTALTTGDGCTLRDAVLAANALQGSDAIKFDATVFATNRTISINDGLPALTGNTTVTGPAAGVTLSITVTGNTQGVFIVNSGEKATFNNITVITVAKGMTAILNRGTATVTNCVLTNTDNPIVTTMGIRNQGKLTAANCIFNDNDNAVFNEGTSTVNNCSFDNNGVSLANYGTMNAANCTMAAEQNSEIYDAGIYNYGSVSILTAVNCTIGNGFNWGVWNDGATMSLINCTLKDNDRAIYNASESLSGVSNLTVTNCTFSANGTAIDNSEILVATNCTIVGNSTGIYNNGGSATLQNTIVTGNTYRNTIGGFTDGGHNITSGLPAVIGLEVDANGKPLLKNNGGPTETIALVGYGVANNGGDNALIPRGISTDGRGPGFPRVNRGTVDIGAYESNLPPLYLGIANAITVNEGSASAPGSATFTVKLTAASILPVTVNYATADGVANGATAGTDYLAKSGTLTFASGETSKTIQVTFIGDDVAERNEHFFLDLKSPTNAIIAAARASAYLRNDDGPGITIDNANHRRR